MTRAEIKDKKNSILSKLRQDVLPFSPDEKEKRIEESKVDFFIFFKTYFPHYAEQEFADFHHEMIELLSEKRKAPLPIAVAAPRGFGKSVIITFGYVLWSVIFRRHHFMVIVSENEDLASDMVEFIKLEFGYNTRVKQDFGNLLTEEGEESDFVANGVRVFARGKKQMMRGFRYKQHRPDCIILDDIEKDESAENPATVLKILKVIKEGIYPSLPPYGKLFIVGTIIRKRSILGTILMSKDEPYNRWTRRLYRAVETKDGKEVSLWEDRWSLGTLREIKENIGTVAFNKEYMNRPEEDESAIFQEVWFRYYDALELPSVLNQIVTFIDPSVEGKATSDFKAIITVGYSLVTMLYYVLNVWVKKASIDDMLHAAYRIYEVYRPQLVGIETNGFQKILIREFDAMAKGKGYHLPIKEINHNVPKESRIVRLSPLVERGKIVFVKNSTDDTKILIEQMLYFPANSVNDDAPDALESAVSMIETSFIEPTVVCGDSRKSFELLHGYRSFSDLSGFKRR